MARNIKPKKVSTGNGRAIIGAIASVAMFGVLVGGIGYVYQMDQREVEIVKFNRDVGIGTEITAADICVGTILTAEYNARANSTWIGNDGTQQSGQIYVRWENAEDVLGMYVTNARRVDDAVTVRDLSSDEIEPNPWFGLVPEGNELYTMKFNASDIYTRMLMPGCTIRMRVITQVPAEDADAFRAQIAQKAIHTDSGVEDSNGYMSAILPYFSVEEEGGSNKSSVPVAEIVFNNLVMLDSLNSNGESIFDLYYSLVNMDSTVREQYIRNNATDLRNRLLPQSLIMSLSPEQATAISEFENAGLGNFKYTIVKNTLSDDGEYSDEQILVDPETGEPLDPDGTTTFANARIGSELYQKFMDIATRINTITINPDSDT